MFFGDSIANFGFSYAMRIGEIPYKDFNMVIPPFSPFIYMVPLFFYNSSITYYITHALLLLALFIIIEKELKDKVYIFYMIICFGYPLALITGLFPGYNFILFLLLMIIICLEKNNKNDLLIGILIGLSILTKHTIGIFFIIPTFLYYYKDIKKIGKRLLGLLIPISIFLIYLLITNTLYSFIDLCVLGIFDFANKNSNTPNYVLLIWLGICIIYYIYSWHKNKKIEYSYGIITLLYLIPIIDIYHFSYFQMIVLYILLKNTKINNNLKVPTIIITIVLISIWSFITLNFRDYKYINYNNYPLRYMSNAMNKDYKYVDYISKKYNKKVILFLLGTENYFYKITSNQEITYFDLPNYGNYGIDGYNKMKKRIDKKHDTYFLVSMASLSDNANNQQYYKELVKYIIEKGKFIEKNEDYSLYYFE